VLLRVFEDGAYADRALRTAAASLDERDRALARRLAFGAVQRKRTLDHAVETLGRRKVHRLDPPVRAALRLGAYQLGFVDGVPRYAAVNESVELVRRARLERAVPFTNAVLRRLAEGIRPLLDALTDGAPSEAALRHSYPDWVARAWWRDLGADGARALMQAQNEPAETVVRLVRGEIDGTPDETVPGAWHVERVDLAVVGLRARRRPGGDPVGAAAVVEPDAGAQHPEVRVEHGHRPAEDGGGVQRPARGAGELTDHRRELARLPLHRCSLAERHRRCAHQPGLHRRGHGRHT